MAYGLNFFASTPFGGTRLTRLTAVGIVALNGVVSASAIIAGTLATRIRLVAGVKIQTSISAEVKSAVLLRAVEFGAARLVGTLATWIHLEAEVAIQIATGAVGLSGTTAGIAVVVQITDVAPAAARVSDGTSAAVKVTETSLVTAYVKELVLA